jgi:hypothetical protein
MNFQAGADEAFSEEDFPPIASDHDDVGTGDEEGGEGAGSTSPPSAPSDMPTSYAAGLPTRGPKRKPSPVSHRAAAGTAPACDLELDTSNMNAFARASLAVLTNDPNFQRLAPQGKKMRRNAIHVSEQAVVDGMAGSLGSDLGFGESVGGDSNRSSSGSGRRGSALTGGVAGVFSGGAAAGNRMPVLSAAATAPTPMLKVVIYLDLNETVSN